MIVVKDKMILKFCEASKNRARRYHEEYMFGIGCSECVFYRMANCVSYYLGAERDVVTDCESEEDFMEELSWAR